MPRIARAVAVDFPHHVTQRGNYQQKVFAVEIDYKLYISLFQEYSRKAKLEIWAYCLIPNHVHFVVVPRNPDSLSKTFSIVHTRYSQYFNQKTNRKGHLWQSRFYSCVLDERHLYAAVRYVEKNPVRAGLVNYPGDYKWSSAQSHIKGVSDKLLHPDCPLISEIMDWKEFLQEPEDEKVLEELRNNTKTGRPAGSNEFIKRMESILGRTFNVRPRGRPKKP